MQNEDEWIWVHLAKGKRRTKLKRMKIKSTRQNEQGKRIGNTKDEQ